MEALKQGTKMKMSNAIDGSRGKEFNVTVLCKEFTLPDEVFDSPDSALDRELYEKLVFVKIEDAPDYLGGDIHLAACDNKGNWTFDPTFWECVGDDIKYYEKALAEAGYKAQWNKKGYFDIVSK